jgi:hypothetical protein
LHRTRNVLARAGLLGVLPEENEEIYREKPKMRSKNRSTSFWNLSNDFHYDVNTEQEFRSKRQMHSSQVDLIHFPVFRTIDELRDFHRSSLRFSNALRSWTPIQLGSTDVRSTSLRTKADLNGRHGDLLLFEYSEQYPILLNETGMFSRICTYLRPVETRENAGPI